MDRLKHGAPIPNVGRARQPDRPRNLRRHIGKNIPVQVGHHDHIERLGGIGQLRRPDIHDPVLLLNLRVLHANLIKHLVKETISHLHDVILDKAGHLLPPIGSGVFKRVPNDFFATRPADQL